MRAPSRLRDRLSRTMLRTVGEYRLLEAADRVLVAVSGGKDSLTMLDLLWEAKAKAPIEFEIIGVHLDQGQPGYDGTALARWLDEVGCPHEMIREDTYSVVAALSRGDETKCVTCSRLRRGTLYTTAKRLGCNKVALGHHRDDALETLLLNLLYAGRLQAMPARYRTNDEAIEVIRPLIECAESDIAEHARESGYPILPCTLCGSQPGLKRDVVAKLLEDLERSIPNVRQVMLGALKNVRATHLLDSELAEAWVACAARYPPRR